jgi:hypothetical protein
MRQSDGTPKSSSRAPPVEYRAAIITGRRAQMTVFAAGAPALPASRKTYLPVYRPGDIFPE